jgi:hypothetical protein
LFCSVLASIRSDALDCIGRKFSAGWSFDRQKSIKNACDNLKNENYIIPLDE